jgi:hypothetical protein
VPSLAQDRSAAKDGAPLAAINAATMQVGSRKFFIDTYQRKVLEWLRPAIEFRMFRPVIPYHIGWPEGMTV